MQPVAVGRVGVPIGETDRVDQAHVRVAAVGDERHDVVALRQRRRRHPKGLRDVVAPGEHDGTDRRAIELHGDTMSARGVGRFGDTLQHQLERGLSGRGRIDVRYRQSDIGRIGRHQGAEEILRLAVLQRRKEDRPILVLHREGEARGRWRTGRSRRCHRDPPSRAAGRGQPVDSRIGVRRVDTGPVELHALGRGLEWLFEAVHEQREASRVGAQPRRAQLGRSHAIPPLDRHRHFQRRRA